MSILKLIWGEWNIVMRTSPQLVFLSNSAKCPLHVHRPKWVSVEDIFRPIHNSLIWGFYFIKVKICIKNMLRRPPSKNSNNILLSATSASHCIVQCAYVTTLYQRLFTGRSWDLCWHITVLNCTWVKSKNWFTCRG